MKNNNNAIPFNFLRKVLLDLGFVETVVPGPYLLFEHSASGTLLPFRAYQPGDSVSWADLAMTRKLLDERGLMEEEEFEALSHKTPA
jgi:hypothetical protein